jgi:two-component system LytT family response regulator
MNIRAAIVDDEAPARARIRRLLKDQPDIQLVREYANGRQAIEGIRRDKPDLVFLDVQMPRLTGFDICEAIGATMPRVIFVTAYDQYALQAFDVHAIDYLLKPFDRARFEKALQRAREQLHVPVEQRLSALLEDLRPGVRKSDRLVIKEDGRIVILRLEQIDWMEADGNYVRLRAGNESHYFRETLGGLEMQLPAGKFLRVNRSTIVNLDRVKELQPKFYGDYSVVLHSGEKLTLSRNFRGRLEKVLGS